MTPICQVTCEEKHPSAANSVPLSLLATRQTNHTVDVLHTCFHLQSEVSKSAPVGYPQSQPALEKKNLGNFQKLLGSFRNFQKLVEFGWE